MVATIRPEARRERATRKNLCAIRRARAIDAPGIGGLDPGRELDEHRPSLRSGAVSIMPSLYGTPEHWITRAKDARKMAENIDDPAAKQAMLGIAENYEKLAMRAEAREVGIGVAAHHPP